MCDGFFFSEKGVVCLMLGSILRSGSLLFHSLPSELLGEPLTAVPFQRYLISVACCMQIDSDEAAWHSLSQRRQNHVLGTGP